MKFKDLSEGARQREQAIISPLKQRSSSRLAAIQALFQIEMTGAPPEKVIEEFSKHRFKEEEREDFVKADPAFFSQLVIETEKNLETIDSLIVNVLAEGWRLERIQPVVRAILRAAIYELLQHKSIPARVIVSEYVDITHAFYPDKEAAFVNGALDRVARNLRPQEF